MNATVLDKADIGEGAIIAAGAVVTHGTKVPAHEIWAGIPAKKVKTCVPDKPRNLPNIIPDTSKTGI